MLKFCRINYSAMRLFSNNLVITILILILINSCEKHTGSGLPVDADGNEYDTVVIGTQTWLTENLKTTKYINGDPIRHVTDNTEWSARTQGAYCWYENNINFKDDYGALYNGYVARMNELLCPAGYHVPTIDEWVTFINALENSSEKIKLSFKIKTFGFRRGDGSFAAYGGKWWSEPDKSPNAISTSFVQGSIGIQVGFSIRCIKNN
jgi:uncharacterized protein (TIGR02145 family)